MHQSGFSNSIRLGDRELFVETAYLSDQSKIVSQISENGHVLDDYQFELDEGATDEQIKSILEEKHGVVSTDWELLSYVHRKVKESNHTQSLNKMGLVLLKRNLLTEAIDCFQEAIFHDSDCVESYINLGNAHVQAELFEQGIEIYNKAIEVIPNYPDLHYSLGMAFLKKNDFVNSIDAFDRALEINPSYDSAHFTLGKVYLASMVDAPNSSEMIPSPLRQRKVLDHLQKAVDVNSYFDQPNLREAMKEIQNGSFEAALNLLNEIEYSDKDEIENHFDEEFYLRFMFGGKGKDEELLSEYIDRLKQQMEKSPNYPDVHNRLGVAYLIQCRNTFLKAIEQFRAALKINPSYKNARKNLKLAENEGKGFIILLRALLK
jgi:tetratricopeptide (TPR) repeat protein